MENCLPESPKAPTIRPGVHYRACFLAGAIGSRSSGTRRVTPTRMRSTCTKRSRRVIWEQEIAGSNPARPTNPLPSLSANTDRAPSTSTHPFASRFACAAGRRTRSASALDEGVRTEQAGADPDELASAWDGGKSPRTLETYRWPVYKLLLPAYEREGHRQLR